MATDGIDLAGDAAIRRQARAQTIGWVEEREKLTGIAEFILDARAKRAQQEGATPNPAVKLG